MPPERRAADFRQIVIQVLLHRLETWLFSLLSAAPADVKKKEARRAYRVKPVLIPGGMSLYFMLAIKGTPDGEMRSK
jgi:hypothetical protein